MAKRMFDTKIIESDAFLSMSFAARCVYFSLNAAADDDGFVNAARGIARKVGANEDSINELIDNRFILDFPQARIVCIKHWNMNNTIRSDRKTPTGYTDELEQLWVDSAGVYRWMERPDD